ncbi:hypothetical protein MJO28_000458 [Puccinia striiformis f. sp. tritici]|uniref:Uncharacterized protein n=1 Tax=Puccinia striiformis f. sp. tritici TaxID=168172 RepID=A0ACC0EZ74_9BASI|nr:hypothetical protein MJO28_000458 [Puccinia striiformis f. sp. tritici]
MEIAKRVSSRPPSHTQEVPIADQNPFELGGQAIFDKELVLCTEWCRHGHLVSRHCFCEKGFAYPNHERLGRLETRLTICISSSTNHHFVSRETSR